MLFVQFGAKSKKNMEEKILYKDLSYRIVGLAMQVHTELGFGFMEKVYENSLVVLFEENGIRAAQQVPIGFPSTVELLASTSQILLLKTQSF